MPVLKRLQSYLDTNKIPYEVVTTRKPTPPTTWLTHLMCQENLSRKSSWSRPIGTS